MAQTPLRFDSAPTGLELFMTHGGFDIWYGVAGSVLVAVWRRRGTTHPYEPVSASFVKDHVAPRVRGLECTIPATDAEVDSALAQVAS